MRTLAMPVVGSSAEEEEAAAVVEGEEGEEADRDKDSNGHMPRSADRRMAAAAVMLLHLSALRMVLFDSRHLAAIDSAHWLECGLGSEQMALASCESSVCHVRRRGIAEEVELDMDLHMSVLVLHMLLLGGD
jgi:hypothetical protein